MASSLTKELSRIDEIVDIDKLKNIEVEREDIQRYYRLNSLPYLVHSPSEFVHMGISQNGSFKKDDLKEQARIVEEYIEQKNAKKVLELAMGKGANSRYLANRHPEVEFYGIDITEKHVKKAEKQDIHNNNFKPSKGDFHDLGRFDANSFDVVFIIEALCYAEDKSKVLSEVSRILKPEGVFMVFDGYTSKPRKELTEDELTAQKLMEKGMLVEEFEPYQEFRNKISTSNFEITYEEDASEDVLPTLNRFRSWSDKFFNHPHFARVLAKILPNAFVYNSISGALLAPLVEEGISTYHITVLEKTAD